MHDTIKHFLLWITGDGKWVLFALAPAALLFEAGSVFVGAFNMGRNLGKKKDDQAAQTAEKPRKRRSFVWPALLFSFFFYIFAAYVGDRM
jgi:hypothetical protein